MEELSNILFEEISKLDKAIFKKKANISILNKHESIETVVAEFLTQKNIIWRLLVKDEYVIYKNALIAHLKDSVLTSTEIESYLTITACHEVRHRFQIHNPNKVIPIQFFNEDKDRPLISSVVYDTELRSYESEYIRLLELDANLISQLCSIAYWHKDVPLTKIVSGDLDNIKEIIKKLGL